MVSSVCTEIEYLQRYKQKISSVFLNGSYLLVFVRIDSIDEILPAENTNGLVSTV